MRQLPSAPPSDAEATDPSRGPRGAPVVSVIIPVYNRADLVAEAIESVLAQTYRDFELIVVDDGSTDDTPRTVASYGSRIRAFRKSNGGFASALNLGIREARGRWIAWLSSDDLWEADKLRRQMEVSESSERVGLIFTDFLKISLDGSVLGRVEAPDVSTRRAQLLNLFRGCYINGDTALIRTRVLQDVGLFDERERLAGDLDLWFRILAKYDIAHVAQPLVRYRVHPGQASTRVGELEHEVNRILGRAFHATGGLLAVEGILLCLKDRILSLGWRARRYGGPWTAARLFIIDFVVALVRE